MMDSQMEFTSKDDMEIEPVDSEIEDSESTPAEFEITTYPADFTLEVLYQKWKSHEIIIPKFQRGFVWKKLQSSLLIDSFMMGLPVPQIFLYTDVEQKHVLIDGQQRLKSVFYFFEGYFGEPDESGKRKVFTLDEINKKSKWFGRTFDQFEKAGQRKLKNSVLRAIIVRQLDPNDDTCIYHIFQRLNTGGTLLREQEVRNCVYAGALNELLLELNGYPAWREILGKPKPDSRQKDVELILRYMMLFHWADKYEKPLKDFMSKFMNRNRNPPDDFLDQERKRFKTTCDLVIKNLGEKPFNPRGAFSAATYDCVFIAFARHGDSCPKDISKRYRRLISNSDFDKYTRNHTTDLDSVSSRLKMAEKLLFG